MKDDSIVFVFARFRRDMGQISQLNSKKKGNLVDLGEKALRIYCILNLKSILSIVKREGFAFRPWVRVEKCLK